MLDILIQRGKDDVHQAIMQFVARRSYRLSKPWYIEGIRIEAPDQTRSHNPQRGFWASLSDIPQIPRIEIELKRRQRATRLKINISNHPESTKLAYELHSYLLDDRAYDHQCPAVCPKCAANVVNVIARYCGRCGQKLIESGEDRRPQSIPRATPMRSPPRKRKARVAPPPPIPIPLAADPIEPPLPVESKPVIIERAEVKEAEKPASEAAEKPDEASSLVEDDPGDVETETKDTIAQSAGSEDESEPIAEAEAEEIRPEPDEPEKDAEEPDNEDEDPEPTRRLLAED
ncbi:MAG: hypothetical protein ACE5EC_02170 [Phycisphaerae bacterium]